MSGYSYVLKFYMGDLGLKSMPWLTFRNGSQPCETRSVAVKMSVNHG